MPLSEVWVELGITGRVALVVGGGRGVGRAVALTLAAEGADVAVLSRTTSELERTVSEIRHLGRRALALTCDARRRDALEAAYQRVCDELAAPTIVVLGAAAMFVPTKLAQVDEHELDALLTTDLANAAWLCRRAIPAMMDARYGRIVALGSLAARTGVPGGALYAATKAGLDGLMRGIALDYSRRGITANTVAMSFVDTERLRARTQGDPEKLAALERATALRRLVTPEEVAQVVAFVCSARASAITGTIVDADGGAALANLW